MIGNRQLSARGIPNGQLTGLGFQTRERIASIGIAAGLNAKTLSTYLGRDDHDYARPLRPLDAGK